MVSSPSRPAPGHRAARRWRGPLAASLAALVLLAAFAGAGYYLWHALFPPPHRNDSCRVVGESTGTVYTMDPEQLLNASIIADVAMQRQLPTRAVVIALATAQQESKLRNLAGGDADSVGLFQQRPSQGWGSVAELSVPQTAAGKFYDALVKVPSWQSLPLTEAAQAVQRSAYPDAYRDWEPRATALGAALTGETFGQLSCVLAHPGVAEAATRTIQPGDTTAYAAAPTVDAASQLLQAQVTQDLGVTAAVGARSATTSTLVVAGLQDAGTSGRQSTAAVAAWALAHAAYDGITHVVVGDQEWRADHGDWQHTGTAAAAGSVVLTIGS